MGVCPLTTFADSVSRMIDEKLNSMHTAVPGKITSFDPSTGLATVKPIMQIEKPNGERMDYPEISGVPVCIPQGSSQGAVISYPVKEGDGVVLLAGEQSLDQWLYGRETDTDLRFDLSNSMAIPGLFQTGSDALQKACSEDAVVIQNGDTVVSFSSNKIEMESGGVKFAISGGKLTIEGDVEVTGKVTTTGEVEARGKKVSTHTHTDSSGGRTTSPN